MRVEIEGLRKELEENVRAFLTVDDLDQEDLSGGRILALHRRGEGQIRTALEPFGYYRPEIDSELETESERWVARYRIDPGPPLRVRSRSIELAGEGEEDSAVAGAARRFPLGEGDVLVHSVYEEGKAALEAAAAIGGYIDAAFEVSEIRIDLVGYHADVFLSYHTGPRYFFGATLLEQSVVDPDILQGYIPWKEGEPFDHEKLLEVQVGLGASPYFRRVEVAARRDEAEDRRVPIEVRLVPAKPRIFRGGVGYGTDTGARARAGLEWRRVNRRGHQAATDVVVSEVERTFETSYRIPAPYPRTDVISFAAGYADDDTVTARSRTGLVSGSFSRNLGKWRESFSLAYRRENFEVGVDQGIVDLLIPEVAFGKVTADDRIYPAWGRRLDLAARGAAEGFLTDTSFLQLSARAKNILSFGRVRLITRAETGWTDADDFRSLPASLRFFAGGDQSVRGYEYQELGRRDEEGNVIGGEALLVGSLELDRLFLDFGRFGQWGAAVFYDVGSAARDFGDSLSSGAGAGIRWLSPIGLVRMDVAWALDSPGTPVRFHLNVGPDF
ncbi:MAG TPA: autotransporter assembly complex family protein [Thermoanaerobaculia bacterium]|nr:autotransporter assembly complex family protein [Thermoanaerobaculia bacterium]